jgi:DNA-3-methyladenine glycosylase I
MASSYCQLISSGNSEAALHQAYHDTEYGFPVEDDNQLFGRLILEINQA